MNFGAQHTPLVTINADVMEGLPEDLQTILREEGAAWGVRLAEIIAEKQVAGLETLKDAGLTVRSSDPEASRAWAERLPDIPRQRFDEAGGEGSAGEAIYAYIDALEAAGATLPRDWSAER